MEDFFCWFESGFEANQLGSERIVGEHNFKPCEPYDARRTREILSGSTQSSHPSQSSKVARGGDFFVILQALKPVRR